ncbi:putative F-box protein At5g66830 isoform X2 [Carica papaya]|uniref:putative F-box protein At5g66830 isoform X2 n=1 Tax=Carica papaya TaxID=3649 RepID=UPI000B8D0FCF|nr:putative F-box protein At5g66830 isoform X2 [Carica papaya]XP_021890398.1 putative F-box protein At5g66830 isoform X2 [Carica papaya]
MGSLLTGGSSSKGNKESCKRRKVSPLGELRPWSELPDELLNIISKRLSMVDYFSFGHVCTKWRSSSMASSKDFFSSVPPLVIVLSSRGKKACFFFNICDGRRYETKLPCFTGKFLIGSSSGYLIMEGTKQDLWLTNPVTGHKLEMIKLLQPTSRVHLNDLTIFASTIPQKDFLVVSISFINVQLQFRRSKDVNWHIYKFPSKSWRFFDLVVFKFKVYALGTDCQIATLSLKSPPSLTLLKLKGKPRLTNFVKFVASDQRLLVVDFIPSLRLEVYEVDISRMEWVKVTDLGDQALFISDMKSSRLCNATKWGGFSNCLYHLTFMAQRCTLYSLAGKVIGSIEIDRGGIDI